MERQELLDTIHQERFVDMPPPQIYAKLLDEDGVYFCHWRTMYRVLHSVGEVRERRDQLEHPRHAIPRLKATGPNQVWSWDITKLAGPSKGVYQLYVVIDLYSRYVVGWLLATKECQFLAEKLLEETYEKQGVEPGQLAVHSDRGPAMISGTVVDLLVKLEVSKTVGRPRVSNDNPFSESQFKTMKYRPEFPSRFGSFNEALSSVGASSLGTMTSTTTLPFTS